MDLFKSGQVVLAQIRSIDKFFGFFIVLKDWELLFYNGKPPFRAWSASQIFPKPFFGRFELMFDDSFPQVSGDFFAQTVTDLGSQQGPVGQHFFKIIMVGFPHQGPAVFLAIFLEIPKQRRHRTSSPFAGFHRRYRPA